MTNYACQYQDFTGPKQLENLLKGKVPAETLSEIKQLVGEARTGILEVLNPNMHISSAFIRAKHLAEHREMNQLVIIGDGYFVVDPKGQVSGSLESQCRPDTESSQEWARTAIDFGDADLFAKINCLLPEKPVSPLKNERIIRLAMERAVEEFSTSILLPGMTVGRYVPEMPMDKDFLKADREFGRAGEVIEVTATGALVRFSADVAVEPIEVPRDQLYDASKIMGIAIEIDQADISGRSKLN
jgi:hypothetical protein